MPATVIEALRRFLPDFLRSNPPLSTDQRRALWAMTHCRTAALGGDVFVCKRCGRRHFAFHSCNHKACPQCGRAATANWVRRELRKLVKAPYFLVTFTLPEQLRQLFFGPQAKEAYDLFFAAVAGALSEKLAADTTEALNAVGGDSGAEDGLMTAIRRLERVAERAEGLLDQPLEALERALMETREALARLEEAQNKLDFEPGRLEKVESRLFALRAAARKHQCRVDDLEALAKNFAARLEAIETGEGRIEILKKDAAEAKADYLKLTEKLSAAREKAAKKLDKAVSGELAPLMLGKARFVTRVEPLDEKGWGPEGGDRVVFEIATIPNAPPGPLSRIASGGELSRFLLALRVVLAATGSAPTLIFDEVDRGVGGAVADAVGERLARLAEDAQVLVVTHSPQVAARGRNHWRISKSDGRAAAGIVTTVETLDAEARREEIARMLSGAKITDEARAAATSLMQA